VKKPRPPEDPDSSKAAYFRALRWLTARELSEGQVRSRLAEKGYTDIAIQPALERLIRDRTIDDRRVDRDLAKEIVREVFSDEDEEALLGRALEIRLRGNPERLKDPRERRKILAYLIRQGFSASAASAAIRAKLKR
jgi:SOS response regulatory protein OraA/RecX